MKTKYSEGKDYSVVAFIQAIFYKDEQIRILESLTQKAGEHNIKFVFFSTLSDFYNHSITDSGEKTIFDQIDVERFDAIVIMSESFKENDKLIELINKAYEVNVPCFSVDKKFENCINLHYEYTDTFKKIVKHMVEFHGYRNIDFIAGMPNNKFSDERIEVFKEVLADNGIPFDENRVFYGDFWEDPTFIVCDKLLKRGMENTDAIICANDTMALTALDYFQRAGFKIPEDFAISGYDGSELSQYTYPRLTTSNNNLDELLNILLKRLSKNVDNSSFYQEYPVYSDINIGNSCGCKHEGRNLLHTFPQIMHLKRNCNNLIMYQMVLSEMTARVSSANNIQDFANLISHCILKINANSIWVCANERLQSIYTDTERRTKSRHEELSIIHYSMLREEPEKNFIFSNIDSYSEIIPDLNKVLEDENFILVLPMHVHGNSLGYMAVSFDTKRFDYMCCTSFINSFEYMIEIRGEQLNTMRIYMHDSLTGLYNRNGFYYHIKNILKEHDTLSIISLDMDDLKKINDTYGHTEGDRALNTLGRIIRESTTKNELAARIGGDEFLIAFSCDDSNVRVLEIVHNIMTGVVEYNKRSETPYRIQTSIGTFTGNSSSHTLDYFLKMADDLMYEMKAEHKKK